MSRLQSSWMSTKRTTRSLSCASSIQGETFPSWSRRVTRISSPGSNVRPTVRESAKFSVVMFGPKTISSCEQPRNRAALARASSNSTSVRRLVSYGPLTFAFDSRR